jgi:putative transposase
LYARGMSTRDIQAHFEDVYGVEVSPTFISQVTNAVLDEVKAWQQRPLAPVYPIVYLDCLVVRSRETGSVQNKTVYLALGVNCDGEKELLGLWLAQTEGAKFWLSVMNELKNRGLDDIFIACVDGLKGFPDAIEAVYPNTQVQLCIVHQIRNSLRFVSWKERKAVAADLKTIYGAATLKQAEQGTAQCGCVGPRRYVAGATQCFDHCRSHGGLRHLRCVRVRACAPSTASASGPRQHGGRLLAARSHTSAAGD